MSARQALPARHQAVTFAIQLEPSQERFVLECIDSQQRNVQVEFPSWVIPQWLRMLPHLDAALQQGVDPGHAPLVAYPLDLWSLAFDAHDGRLTVCLRDGRQVDSAFVLDRPMAEALHRAIGDALAQAGGAG